MTKNVKRLAEQFQPEHYDLRLQLDKDAMAFKGTLVIRGKKVGRPSQRITFHQKDLKISSAKVVKHDKRGELEIPVSRINHHDSFNEVRLHSEQMIYPGSYVITLEFSGKITDSMTGIYPCYFKDGETEKVLIMTQFESHFARQAFPCIDEPEAKATFDLTLETQNDLVVLCNTPLKNQTKNKDFTTSTFETTPRMSSYLLAFVVGELHSKSTKTNRGTDVSVWATVAQPADALDFPLHIAKKSIEYFEDYFGVPYPLPKADHVAVPDFSNGAMENWGLITYRERALLVYPDETAQSIQEYIATVIAHETSHQWFGNLVTMKWWDDLWLNESFANLMEYQAVNDMHPEWHLWDTFVAQEGLSALRRDATPGVQAVKSQVHHPDEINNLFDPSIVYAKGGRLLYMLKNYIGDDAFRKGLSTYFTKHAYSNTTGADLWAALSEASGKDIGSFMNPWLEQSGFPLVSVTQKGRNIRIAQEHFQDNPKKADKNRLWPVPLFITNANEAPDLFDKPSVEFELKNNRFIGVNGGARGHYIVRYTEPAHRAELNKLVKAGKPSEAERLMLLNDTSMLARAGYQPYNNVLEMLGAFENEVSEPVWDMISLVIGELRRFIDLDDSLEDKIKALVRKLIARQYKRLGWEEVKGEPASDTKLRATIIGLGAYAEEPAIIQKSLELFETYKKAPEAVPAELRSIVFTVPVKQQVPGALDHLVKLHDGTQNSDLKSDLAAALTTTRSGKEASRLLERLKDAKLVKPQDADRWLIYLIRNRHVKEVAWDWMVDNWGWIEETYKQDKSYDMLPRYTAGACNTKEWADKYRTFFEPKADQIVLKRNITMGLEEIAARVAWLSRDLASVQQFFTAQ